MPENLAPRSQMLTHARANQTNPKDSNWVADQSLHCPVSTLRAEILFHLGPDSCIELVLLHHLPDHLNVIPISKARHLSTRSSKTFRSSKNTCHATVHPARSGSFSLLPDSTAPRCSKDPATYWMCRSSWLIGSPGEASTMEKLPRLSLHALAVVATSLRLSDLSDIGKWTPKGRTETLQWQELGT